MSHDATAVRSVREASRRRVSFQTSMEDLEGRVLLSGGHHYRPPRVHVQVRVVHRPPAARAASARASSELRSDAGTNDQCSDQCPDHSQREPGYLGSDT